MHLSVRHFLSFFIQYGAVGLGLLAIADSSFFFLPVGLDLLTVILVARDPARLLLYVAVGAAGSAIGVFLLDVVCRKGGEEGLKHLVKPKLLDYLRQQMEKRAAIAVVVACLAPPPFPFTASIAVSSALQYPRTRLLTLVFFARTARFALVAWAALHFGPEILNIAKSAGFLWFMGGFIVLCVVGSILSIVHWVHAGKNR